MYESLLHNDLVIENPPKLKPKILLVEDNQLNRMVTRLYLKDHFDVNEASDGLSAIALASMKQYDMILMDINLGDEIDGIETMNKIRLLKKYEKIPIVAVTAYAMMGDKEKFLDSGFTDYISKPLKMDPFISFIKKNLSL